MPLEVKALARVVPESPAPIIAICVFFSVMLFAGIIENENQKRFRRLIQGVGKG